MNWDQVSGRWRQVSGLAKSKWAKLTDDDAKNLEGKTDQLVGLLQEHYGILKEQAEKHVDTLIGKLKWPAN